MVNTLSFSPLCSLVSPCKPGAVVVRDSNSGKVFPLLQSSRSSQLQSLQVKAEAVDSNKSPKATKSILCSDCEGNGAVQCKQCKGTGVNAVDHFNGRFKAGGLCWLCRGKREILCGSCNGAGFIGGFMSTYDE